VFEQLNNGEVAIVCLLSMEIPRGLISVLHLKVNIVSVHSPWIKIIARAVKRREEVVAQSRTPSKDIIA
jgi:hypothetical protein